MRDTVAIAMNVKTEPIEIEKGNFDKWERKKERGEEKEGGREV